MNQTAATPQGMPHLRVRHSGWVVIQKISDGRDGCLNILEVGRQIEFPIRRVYYINQLENCVSVRGRHAHRTLSQVIFCINGSFILSLDDGEKRQEIPMWRDNVGVLLGPNLWHEMHSFSTGCVLLVVASDVYDEADYIRDYDAFLRHVRAPAS